MLASLCNLLSILGAGIGGFIGGQIVDGLGLSLSTLFNITAVFLFAWAVTFYCIYRMFCKKFEEALIKQKEEETLNLGIQQHSSSEFKDNLEDEQVNYINDPMCKLSNDKDIMNSMKYWLPQTAGISRL